MYNVYEILELIKTHTRLLQAREEIEALPLHPRDMTPEQVDKLMRAQTKL
jgi:hypothetical protein